MSNFKIIQINEIDTRYMICDEGYVISLNSNKILKPEIRSGYYSVNIYLDGIPHKRTIHRLVAEAFIENPYNKPEVNHKDGNKLNVHADNLEWATKSENAIHAFNMKLRKNKIGIDSHLNKYPESTIINICELLKDGYTNIEISRALNVDDGFVYVIRNKGVWHHITDKYVFPKLNFNYSKKHSSGLRSNIIYFIEKGFTDKKIRKKLDLEDSKCVYDLIYRLRKSVRDRSTTIEPQYYTIKINTGK